MTAALTRVTPPRIIHVNQGEYAVAAKEESLMTAVLGSCVAACLTDPAARVGGMNHFLLPEARRGGSEQIIYGAQAMELLINALLKQGACKSRLEAKLFGGANMVSGLSGIGRGNAQFAEDFLRAEEIPCMAKSLRGTRGRRIRFWPLSGRVQQLLLREDQKITVPTRVSAPVGAGNDVELF